MTGNMTPELMTVPEVAVYLRTKERTVYDWLQRGVIPAFKVGNTWRFRRSEIDRWLESERSGPSQYAVPKYGDPLVPPSPVQLTKRQQRERAKQAYQATVDACVEEVEGALELGTTDVLIVEPFLERYGEKAARDAIKDLVKRKKVKLEKHKGADDVIREILRRR
jgi:excisionase family DNA binding protein